LLETAIVGITDPLRRQARRIPDEHCRVFQGHGDRDTGWTLRDTRNRTGCEGDPTVSVAACRQRGAPVLRQAATPPLSNVWSNGDARMSRVSPARRRQEPQGRSLLAQTPSRRKEGAIDSSGSRPQLHQPGTQNTPIGHEWRTIVGRRWPGQFRRRQPAACHRLALATTRWPSPSTASVAPTSPPANAPRDR
jgi:hypothetical protein